VFALHRGVQGGEIPSCGGSGEALPRIFFSSRNMSIFSSFFVLPQFRVHCWEIFRHMVFVDGFLFPVKELGLLTNPGH
jgi:hypothetical protein